MKTPLILLLAASAAMPAMAQETGLYASGGYPFLSSDIDGGDSVDLGALGARAGYMFTPYIGAEVEAMFGVQDEDFSIEGIDVSASLNYAVGAFGRAQLPIGDTFAVYGRAGYVNAELEAEAAAFGESFSESDSDSGFGYGAGVEFAFTRRFGVYIDYTRYDFDDAEIDGVSLGGKIRF